MSRPKVRAADTGDEKLVRKVLDKLKRRRPRGVRGYTLERGEDLSGDPALWITFRIDDDPDVSDEEGRELSLYSSTVTSELFKAGIESWPLVRFKVFEEADPSGDD